MLCAVLVLWGTVSYRGAGGTGQEVDVVVWRGFSWLPGFVYGVVLLAKWVMGGVDPEVELTALRYRSKKP